MNLVVSFDEKYFSHCLVMLLSCLEYNDVKKIFLIYNQVSEKNINKMRSVLDRENLYIEFILVPKNLLNEFPVSGHISRMSYARLLIPKVLPDNIKRVLYLDCDIVFNGSIADLWNVDLKGKSIAAVWNDGIDHKVELGMRIDSRYFNAGVILIDLMAVKNLDIYDRSKRVAKSKFESLKLWDQDILNIIFENDWFEVSAIYNARYRPSGTAGYWKSNLHSGHIPLIIHFDGEGLKPWLISGLKHPYRSLYYKFARKMSYLMSFDLNMLIYFKKLNTRFRKFKFMF